MKKVVLSLAGVLAAAAFAPEASAIPAFARQTGMACSACHAQHFPILNGFGRAFKAAGFTMMGAQEKVEGEHLSLPAVLNFGQLLKVRYQKTSGTAGTPSGVDTNGGQWQFPDEYALFVGGRLADNGTIKVGVMAENALAGTPAGIVAGLRVPVVVELDAAKISVIPFTTDSLGAFYGYSESSAGVVRSIRWAEHRKEISAHQYTGVGSGAATGIALLAHNDMGYINVTRFAPEFASATQMASTAFHIAATPTIADWATVISAEIVSGNTAFNVPTKGSGVSAQAHGELAGMEAGVYGQYSKGGDAAGIYGAKSAATAGIDVTVVPHTLSIGAAYRGATSKDNAYTFTAVYDLAQNVALVANFTKYNLVQGTNGDTLFTGMLEAAW
ncbi:MAG: hypothetical protein KKF58_00795 [Gammaproteobacteria bacterium]|nr:hypothetical protein [Gammaproteobacteria bacterium]MBU1446825.1 hypothetical protein [Gammaproteobacteria bacterium]